MEPLTKRKRIKALSDDDKRQKIVDALSTIVFDDAKVQQMIEAFEQQIKFANSPDETLREKTDLFWENTYIRRLLDGDENGTYLGMDLGGTNFRIVRVDMKDGVATTDTKYYDLSKELLSGPSDGVFNHIATCLRSFLSEDSFSKKNDLSLGFTFSFPSTQLSLKHSILKTWTKSITCPDGPGRDPVGMLEEAIERIGGLPVPLDIVGRISDTTGTLLAGNYADHNCRIGLILGTGSNAAFVEYIENIEKWESCYKDDDDSNLVVINCEFGALGDNGCLDFLKTEFDHELDKYSNHPRSYTPVLIIKKLTSSCCEVLTAASSAGLGVVIEGGFEKLYAGHYLGELVRLALVKLTKLGLMFEGKGSDKLFTRWNFTTSHVTAIESDVGDSTVNTLKVLEEMDLLLVSTEEDISLVREVCELVSQRGAYIVATAMVVLLNHINLPDVTIAIDGSLYEHHPKYHGHMMELVARWVPKTKTKMVLVKDGSGQGGALVAAIEKKRLAMKTRK